MNAKQKAILVIAVGVLGLILWHDLPIEYPLIMFKAIMLFVKVSITTALAILAYVLAGGKKKP
jgi:hypothetical protein